MSNVSRIISGAMLIVPLLGQASTAARDSSDICWA